MPLMGVPWSALIITLTSSLLLFVTSLRAEGEPRAKYRIIDGYYLPDSVVTPGQTRRISKERLCSTKPYRDNSDDAFLRKKEVCRLYGQKECPGPKFQVDHLISLGIGGADTVKNIFPMPIEQAKLKDKLEYALKREVCDGIISLAEAQQDIAKDWVAAYRARWRLDQRTLTK
jgi:hypothetical protein